MNKPVFSQNAILNDNKKFKKRVEYGLVAQNKFIDYLLRFNIKPIHSDFRSFQDNMPKIDHPKPDFEFSNSLFEIRRQDIFDPIFLGYTKKYDGWDKYSIEKNKPLYFCIISVDLKYISFCNLSLYKEFIFKRFNPVGDIDYCVSFDFFKSFYFEDGMQEVIKIINGLGCGLG